MAQLSTQSTPAAAAPVAPRNGFGITALVLALVGLVFGIVPITEFLALILGALAVLFGLLAWARARRGEANNRKMAAISTVLGALVAVLGIVGISITFSAVDQFGKDLKSIGHDPAAMSDVAVSDCAMSSEYGFKATHAT
jgi:predicted PurR-regulated permease PerM